MKKRIILLLVLICVFLCGCEIGLPEKEYGFAREVNPDEQELRLQFVRTAEKWLGCNEEDETFKPIIDIYNAHEPLARDYTVKYTDQWCATFVSAVSIQCKFTDIIPTECGCQRQINLFIALNCWQENDEYLPLPGDIIYYASDTTQTEDCTDWANHVGIVVGTNGDSIKVIEGNYNCAVQYRYITVNDQTIRGYALPDYSSIP